jgi:hypothetical protein
MLGLKTGGAQWWGDRTAIIIGLPMFIALAIVLQTPASRMATNFGAIFKAAGLPERRAMLGLILTYLAAVNFLPAIAFVVAAESMYPAPDAPVASPDLHSMIIGVAVLMLLFAFSPLAGFVLGLNAARRKNR